MKRTLVLVSLSVLVLSQSGCKLLKKKNGQDYAPDYGSKNGGITQTTSDYGTNNGGGFPQTFTPKSGLVRLHYPSDLVANPDSDNLTFLEPQKNASVSARSLVTFTTNQNPISQDPNEYARVLQGARAKALTNYKLLSTTPGMCWKDIPGVETRWSFDETGVTLQGRACAFVHRRHGYSFMYAFNPTVTGDEAKLRRVIDAAGLTD